MTLRICCFMLVFIVCSGLQKSSDCDVWSGIGNYLKENMGASICEQNEDCTGLNCTGTVMGMGIFYGGIQVMHCSNPVRIKLFADVPQLSIHQSNVHWEHSFVHGDTFKILDDILGEITLKKEADHLVVSLKLKLLRNELQYLSSDRSTYMEKNILKDATIPVPLCDNESHKNENMTMPSVQHEEPKQIRTRIFGNCSIENSTCSQNEICQQLEKYSPAGVCICLPKFFRSLEGACVHSQEANISDETSSSHYFTEGNASGTNSGRTFVLPLIVSLAVLLLLISLIYFIIKLKVLDRIHRRLRVRVYEQVQLDQDDDDNDDPLTSPVA